MSITVVGLHVHALQNSSEELQILGLRLMDPGGTHVHVVLLTARSVVMQV